MPIYNAPITTVDKEETRRYAGLRSNASFPEELLDQACLSARLLAHPRGCWRIYPYCSTRGTIMSQEPFDLSGLNITRHLEKSEKIAVLAVTIGLALEGAISEHFAAGEYTAGLLLDAAGSTAVETAADALNAIIVSQAAAHGLTGVRRFSPGYGDWRITDQPRILTLAGGEEIDLTVTTTCMLQPRKSVTAVIGLTATDNNQITVESTSGSCQYCQQTNCLSRRESC